MGAGTFARAPVSAPRSCRQIATARNLVRYCQGPECSGRRQGNPPIWSFRGVSWKATLLCNTCAGVARDEYRLTGLEPIMVRVRKASPQLRGP